MVNPQTGTSYTFQQTDNGQLVYFSNNGAVVGTLPTPNCWSELWAVYVEYAGSGSLTLTPPAGVTIDGASSLILSQNQGVILFSDGTNFFTERGAGTATSNGWTSTIPANSASAGTQGQYTSDGSFFYICIAANTWRRVAVSSF